MEKCPICGTEFDRFGIHEKTESGECFSCSLWKKRLSLVDNPNVAIIDGVFYTIGDENSTDPFRGFGGDKFVIKFKDGREVTTTNLWCGGDIPEAWKPKFPNNADFDWQWKKIGSTNYLVPKEEIVEEK